MRCEAMQRLFLTFPNGLPGLGLLLLRVCDAVYWLRNGSLHFSEWSTPRGALFSTLNALGAALIALGVWTPLIALAQAVFFSMVLWNSGLADARVMLTVIALSLVMLGPGAYSIDARVFGRRRIDASDFAD
jgi:putative oxidoreductase